MPETKQPEVDEPSVSLKLPKGNNLFGAIGLGVLLGGGGVGGVAGFLRGDGKPEARALTESIARLEGQMTTMQAQLVQVNEHVGNVEKTLTADSEVHRETAEKLVDHEKRIRDIERRLR